MINHFCKHPLWEVSRILSDVAMGRQAPDLVIRDATLVNVCTKELLPHTDVAVAQGRIAMVGDSYVDVKMAANAGSMGIGVSGDPAMREKMASVATVVVNSLEDIAL